MKFVADLHIHSKYARAVSPQMILPELDRWADDKGILVMGTGDFTHPLWYKDLVEQLEPAELGLYRLKKEFKLQTIKGTTADTRFLLTTEISCIYTRAGKGRRVHALIFAPDLPTVKKINDGIAKRGGNLKSDGRPILGMDIVEVLKICLDANPETVLVPAHIYTPWFSIFGSKSGFNSIEECFGDYTKYIFAGETGLSSDPFMSWRWSALDNITLISNSDSHSLQRIGREANILNTELSYAGIVKSFKDNNDKSFVATIEYFPEEGIYHFDGHRKCGVSYDPAETRKHRGLCSSCGKPVTVGVANRLEKLADRSEEKVKKEIIPHDVGKVAGKKFRKRPPYINLVTLDSIIGEALDIGTKSQGVKREYDAMINIFGRELDILMNIPLADLSPKTYNLSPAIIEGIRRMRAGQFTITPGFDGQYGEVHIFSSKEKKQIKSGQTSLF